MPKYLIDMPEGWGFGDWGYCPFTHHCCNDGKCNTDCPLANAVEAVEVDTESEIGRWSNHHLENNKWVSRTEVDGQPVTLYAVVKEANNGKV